MTTTTVAYSVYSHAHLGVRERAHLREKQTRNVARYLSSRNRGRARAFRSTKDWERPDFRVRRPSAPYECMSFTCVKSPGPCANTSQWCGTVPSDRYAGVPSVRALRNRTTRGGRVNGILAAWQRTVESRLIFFPDPSRYANTTCIYIYV